jgi:uncharacterized membrane protein
MKLTRVIFIVAGIIVLSNLLLFYFVRKEGSSVIISLAISAFEVIILGIVSWYCVGKQQIKREFRRL